MALHIDKPEGASFEHRTLRTRGYSRPAEDDLFTFVGMNGVDVDVDGEHRVELMIVNQRPSVDPETGKPYPDQYVMGADPTVEQFEVRGAQAEEIHHVRTWEDKRIASPNRMAMVGSSDSFYLTNSHGLQKVGLKSRLSPILGTGEVEFCSREGGCKTVSTGHKFPNGLAQHDGLVYVPSSLEGTVSVYRIGDDNELKLLETIATEYPLDNISVDANGDLWVAALPDALLGIFQAFKDPFNARTKSTVLRIRKGEDGKHTWEKVLEDGEGVTLPATTTVVHDAKTGRLFMSSECACHVPH